MDAEVPNDPRPGDPAAHWGTTHPEDQPSHAAVAGLGRLVTETRNRLGPGATLEAVAAELRGLGVEADPTEIARWFERAD